MEIKQVLHIYNQTKNKQTQNKPVLLSIKASLNLQVKIGCKNYGM